MKYLVILLLIIFPFGQLARFDAGHGVVIHLNDLAVLLALLFGLRKISGPLVRPLVIFALAAVLSLLLNFLNFKPADLLVASLYPLRFLAYAGLFFVFYNQSEEIKNLSRRWLLLATIIIAMTGLLQYFFIPNVSFLSALDWDDHYFRLIGTFLDPGFTGAILVLGLLIVYLTKYTNTLVYWCLLASIYVSLALTYSRASYLMYLASFAAVSVYKKSLKIFVIATVVLGLTIFILPTSKGEGTRLNRENSTWARIHNWQESLAIWQKAPLFGVGFDTYRYVRNIGSHSHSGAGADSSLLLVLATTGIIGFAAYLNLLKALWAVGKENLLFKVSFLGILVHSFFNNTLFYPWVMEWLWLLLALS